MDMSQTIIAKSDQLNADDLGAGPRTIKITKVSGNEGNADQPVNIFYEGDGGKPFRPCKTVRRVLVAAWGIEAKQYVGRSITIYNDPRVKWGGMQVGGIRISHMSHIEREITVVSNETKGKKAPTVVKPLQAAKAGNGAKAEQKAEPKPEPPKRDDRPGAGAAAYTGSEPVYEVRNAFGEIAEMLTGPLYLVAMDKLWGDAATALNEQELLAVYEQNAETIDALPDELKQAMRDSYKRHKATFGGKKK